MHCQSPLSVPRPGLSDCVGDIKKCLQPKRIAKGRQWTRECIAPNQITLSDLHLIGQALQGSTIEATSPGLYRCNNIVPTSRSLN